MNHTEPFSSLMTPDSITMMTSIRSWLLLIIVTLLASCSSTETTISETIPEYSRDAILEFRKIENNKAFPETADLLGKSVAVFSIVLTPDAPQHVVESLHQNLLEKIDDAGLYPALLSDQRLTALLSQNPKLLQAKEIYLDSLTIVSVSDKDISNPLGKTLETENFLVFQLDLWPCADCKQNNTLRMKLRLVDSETSFIIWTGIAEMQKIELKELNDIDAIALKLAEDLLEEFNLCFSQKWHRKRFDNLAKSMS
jgi:hypothetical protein